MSRRALPLLLFAAGGCATVPPESAEQNAQAPVPVGEAEGGTACDATQVRHLIGRQQSEAVATEAMRLSGARALRWLRPGSVVTMDYRTDRLNIHVDGKGRITDLRCG
ncbi:hypothetical protein E2493_00215 [Sphingomonas parva]|uniref:Peptidase inhibitor I78 n=1 Tax=Sphingomonas parva TaxID=2555898 RepID=A0A4Y8ZZE9_9SPHN|nr:I78 family peptidase inhibitor [Sphingomonas parva]TFI60176.1 hypothetical protein E2493_00215 [Sphingomonas parva]